ncbi:MAG: hypothetical protein Q8O40_07975, partial [Chloroflexota bacterium]|nr:hypothetical protein [Chloroflexota bacterium]
QQLAKMNGLAQVRFRPCSIAPSATDHRLQRGTPVARGPPARAKLGAYKSRSTKGLSALPNRSGHVLSDPLRITLFQGSLGSQRIAMM